jgi:hypothetical protein
VVISYVPGRFTPCVSDFVLQRLSSGRAFHLRREAQGGWRKVEIPLALNAFGRSQIVLDDADNAYVVLPFGCIVAPARPASRQTNRWASPSLCGAHRFHGPGQDATCTGFRTGPSRGS